MKRGNNKAIELAALHALGALDGADAHAFTRLRAESADARKESASFGRVAEALAGSLPDAAEPSPDLRTRILNQVNRAKAQAALRAQLHALAPKSEAGLAFLKHADVSGWLPLRVPGAFVKLLSFDPGSDHAVLLGKLDPGARYPSHHHRHGEDLFMLSGDLHVGDEIIHAGDFHHADAGSDHGVNWSESGCVLLAILAKEDLFTQFGVA